MKLTFLISYMAALMAVLCADAAQDGSNSLTAIQLKNPGLEGKYRDLPKSAKKAKITGQIADGWSDNSDWADVDVDYAADKTAPHRGETAQRISIAGFRSGAVQFVQRVALKKNHAYAFKVWMRGSAGTMLGMELRKAGAPYNGYGGSTAVLSPEWKEFSAFAVIPEDTDVFLMLRAGSTMTFWIDDASIEDVSQVQADTPPRVGNLLNGGSFDAGVSFGWNVSYRGPMGNRFADTRPAVDTSAVHGASSLRFDILPGDEATVRSHTFPLAFNRQHTAAMSLKSSVADAQVRAEISGTDISQTLKVGREWKRFTISGTVPYLPSSRLRLACRNTSKTNSITVWLDAAQVEEGAGASPYGADFPADMTLRLARPGHVVFDGEQAAIEVGIAPTPPDGSRIRLSATDIYGARYDIPDLKLPSAAIPLPSFDRRGMFKLRGQVLNAEGRPITAPAELVWARLPKPRELDPRKSFFGLHMPLTPYYIALARAVGIRRVRLHDTSMIAKWPIAEPQPGKWEFHDDGVTAARDAGLAILGMLDGAPAWTSTKPREGGYWGVWNIPDKPDAIAKWENYVRTVSTHYKGRIDEWEVWNEPWGRWFKEAGGKPELYGQLVRSARQVLKETNPNATLIAIDAYRGNDDWTTNALAAAGPEFFDGFSFHDYSDAIYGGPDNLAMVQARQFNDFQKRYGEPKPLWNTEGNSGDIGSFYAPNAGGMPCNLQPTYIVRFDVCHMAAGVKAFYLYGAHADPGFAELSMLTTEHDRAVRPILAARAVLASLVDGSGAPVRSEPVKGLDVHTFQTGNGQAVDVAWSYDGATHDLPVPEGAKVLDVFGNPKTATDTVQVGTEPVYLLRQAR